MPKQKSIKPFPYILEEDRDTPEEQTIFYLMPRTVEESSLISGFYSGAVESKPGFRNADRVNPKVLERGQINTFVNCTIGEPGVIHYRFSDKFSGQSNNRPDLHSKGWFNIKPDDHKMLTYLALDLRTNQLQELFEVADRGFSDTEKKKLNYSDTLSTGSKPSHPDEDTTVVDTVKSSE